jgi:hypothetical protein
MVEDHDEDRQRTEEALAELRVDPAGAAHREGGDQDRGRHGLKHAVRDFGARPGATPPG